MSKKEEILHKLSTEDRNYIKKKFKELESKLEESERQLNYTLTLLNRECDACKPNQIAIDELNKVHKFFSKTFIGVGLNTYCEKVRPVETFIIEEIKKLQGDE